MTTGNGQRSSVAIAVMSARSDLGRLGHTELPIKQVERDRQVVLEVGRRRHLPWARMPCSCMNLCTRSSFARMPRASDQFLPDARPATATRCLGLDSLDAHQQHVFAQMARPLSRFQLHLPFHLESRSVAASRGPRGLYFDASPSAHDGPTVGVCVANALPTVNVGNVVHCP